MRGFGCELHFAEACIASGIGLCAKGAICALLVKPQFEAGREAIGKGGILRDPKDGARIAEELKSWLETLPGWRALGLCPSPIEGGDGNLEYLPGRKEGPMTTQLTIRSIGAGGDGVANLPDGQIYVPFTLPGEVANVARDKNRATVMALLETSPERQASACQHFEDCGGCALQHWQDEPYRLWKRELVVSALKGGSTRRLHRWWLASPAHAAVLFLRRARRRWACCSASTVISAMKSSISSNAR